MTRRCGEGSGGDEMMETMVVQMGDALKAVGAEMGVKRGGVNDNDKTGSAV